MNPLDSWKKPLDKRQYRKIKTTTIKYTKKFHGQLIHRSWTLKFEGSDCFNSSAFSGSKTQSVNEYLEHVTLNFTTSLLLLLLLIFTDLASSFLICIILPYCSEKEILVSWICWGTLWWGMRDAQVERVQFSLLTIHYSHQFNLNLWEWKKKVREWGLQAVKVWGV